MDGREEQIFEGEIENSTMNTLSLKASSPVDTGPNQEKPVVTPIPQRGRELS